MRRVAACFDLSALACSRSLHNAVASDDIETVTYLLREGSQVDELDDFNSTPLHIAAWRGDFEITKALLQHGAQANKHRRDGRTPLDLAELRLRGTGDIPPEGLSTETYVRDCRRVASLLREATEGQDVALRIDLESTGTGDVMLICTTLGGVQRIVLQVDPATQYLHSIQEKLASTLNVPPARLRLIKLGATRLPTEAENRMTLSEFFSFSLKYEGPCIDSSVDQGIAHTDGRLNSSLQESVSSVTTCTTITELTHDTPPESPGANPNIGFDSSMDQKGMLTDVRLNASLNELSVSTSATLADLTCDRPQESVSTFRLLLSE